MKRLFLIDVDGVAAKLVEHTIDKMVPKFGRVNLPTQDDLKGQHDLFRKGKTPFTDDQLAYAHKILQAKGFAKSLPVIDGAVEAVKKIRKAGHEVIWLTAPWLSSETWDYDRRHWLEKTFKTKQTDVIMAHHKALVAGDVFIDDKPDHVFDWRTANQHGKAFLFDQPWNKDAPVPAGEKPPVRFTWEDIEKLLADLSG